MLSTEKTSNIKKIFWMDELSKMADQLVSHMRNMLLNEEFEQVLGVIEEGKNRRITVPEAQEAILRIIDTSQGEDTFLIFVTRHYFLCVNEYTQTGKVLGVSCTHT